MNQTNFDTSIQSMDLANNSNSFIQTTCNNMTIMDQIDCSIAVNLDQTKVEITQREVAITKQIDAIKIDETRMENLDMTKLPFNDLTIHQSRTTIDNETFDETDEANRSSNKTLTLNEGVGENYNSNNKTFDVVSSQSTKTEEITSIKLSGEKKFYSIFK